MLLLFRPALRSAICISDSAVQQRVPHTMSGLPAALHLEGDPRSVQRMRLRPCHHILRLTLTSRAGVAMRASKRAPASGATYT